MRLLIGVKVQSGGGRGGGGAEKSVNALRERLLKLVTGSLMLSASGVDLEGNSSQTWSRLVIGARVDSSITGEKETAQGAKFYPITAYACIHAGASPQLALFLLPRRCSLWLAHKLLSANYVESN